MVSADFQRAGFVYRMGKSQGTQLSKNRNPSITVRPDNRWQEGHGLGLKPQDSQMLTWSLGTYRLGQQFSNHPVTGGILGALLSITSLMTQGTRGAGGPQGCRHPPTLQQARDTHREPERSGTGPSGLFQVGDCRLWLLLPSAIWLKCGLMVRATKGEEGLWGCSGVRLICSAKSHWRRHQEGEWLSATLTSNRMVLLSAAFAWTNTPHPCFSPFHSHLAVEAPGSPKAWLIQLGLHPLYTSWPRCF